MPYRRNALTGCHLIADHKKAIGMTFQKVHMADTIVAVKKTRRHDFRLKSDRTINSVIPIRLQAGVNNRLKLKRKKSFRPRTKDNKKVSRRVKENYLYTKQKT